MKQLTDHSEYREARDALEVAQETRAALDDVNSAQARVDAARKAKANDVNAVEDVLAERAASQAAVEAAQLRLQFANELRSEKEAASDAAKLDARRWILDDAQKHYNDILDSVAEGIATVLEGVTAAAELRRATERAMNFASFERGKHRFKLNDLMPPSTALEELRRWAGLPLAPARRLRRADSRSRRDRSDLQGKSA